MNSILNICFILIIVETTAAFQNKKIQMFPIDKKDLKTFCSNNILNDIDTYLFKTTVNLTQALENSATIKYEIFAEGNNIPDSFFYVAIPSDCKEKQANDIIHCLEMEKNVYFISITSKAYIRNSNGRVKGILTRIDGNEIDRDEILLPSIYNITDATAVISINGKNITNKSGCHLDIGNEELLLEFKCSSSATPCKIEIASNYSSEIVYRQNIATFRKAFQDSDTYSVIIKYAACRLDLNTIGLNCSIKTNHDYNAALGLQIGLPVSILFVCMCIGAACLYRWRRKVNLKKNEEQTLTNAECERMLQEAENESITNNQNDSADNTDKAFQNNSTKKVTDLMDAIKKGKDKPLILDLISRTDNVDIKDEKDRTALMYAAKFGNTEVITYLIEKTRNLEAKDKWGRTALIIAAQYKRKETVQILLENNAVVNTKTNRDWNALMHASLSGQHEICEILLEKANVNDTNQGGKTSLMFASRNGHSKTVCVLLKKGADVNVKETSGKTPLMFGAENGHIETVKVLLNSNADATLKNKDDWTALTFAEQNGFSETATCLKEFCKQRSHEAEFISLKKNSKTRTRLMKAIHKGKEIPFISNLISSCKEIVESTDEKGRTALMHAAKLGNTEVVTLLTDRNCNLRTKDNKGRTALIIATQYKRKTIVKILVAKNVDVNEKSNCGFNALMFASLSGQHEICEILLLNEANVNDTNDCDKTCLMFASRNGHPKTVDLLIKHGADVNAQDECGETPLMFAANNGHVETVKVLLNSNADPSLKNKDFWTAVSFAEQSGFSEIATCIKEYSL